MTLRSFVLSFAMIAALVAPSSAQAPAPAQLRTPDVIFVPTPQEVVDAMLKMAKVSASDVVYDLGSGDGRTPITAAKTYGARGVGIDIDPQRIKEAMENLKTAGVADKVRFLNQDLFTTNISEATVVTLYLLPSLNLKLLAEAQCGAQAWHAGRVARLRHGRHQAAADTERERSHDLPLDRPDQVARFRPGTRARTKPPSPVFPLASPTC